MPSFHCKIGTADGRIVEKTYQSVTKTQLKENLEEQGFHVFQIRRKVLWFFQRRGGNPSCVSGRRFISFNQEMLVLLKSGLPILQIFDTQIEQMEGGAFRDAVSEIREEIRGGSSLSDAFVKYPQLFPPLYVAALKAGEKTGDIAETLTRYLDYQKRVEAIRGKVRSASFYPMLLTIAAVVVVVFLMLYVVPRFTQIYGDANVELPLMTRILITISELVGRSWYLLILGGLICLPLIKSLARSTRGRLGVDRLMLKVPFFGTLRVDYALSSFNRTLGTTLASGTPLVEAMRMSRGTLNNLSLEQKMLKATRQVEEGSALSESLQRTGFYPPLALRMVCVGETSGSLRDMLNDIADYYEAEVERRLTRMTTMIEPLLMMSMGLLIAFIIVAMYVPIFQLAGAVG